MKSIAVLSNLLVLHYFYHGIQCDKNRNFVHGEAFEVQHIFCIDLCKEFKRHTKSIANVQFPYLPTFKFQKEEQMREKNLKRGTFLNFLYITIQRLLQK